MEPRHHLTIQASNANTVNVSDGDEELSHHPRVPRTKSSDSGLPTIIAIRSVADTAVSGTLSAVAVLFIFCAMYGHSGGGSLHSPFHYYHLLFYVFCQHDPEHDVAGWHDIGSRYAGGQLHRGTGSHLPPDGAWRKPGQSRHQRRPGGFHVHCCLHPHHRLGLCTGNWMGGLIAQVFNDLAISSLSLWSIPFGWPLPLCLYFLLYLPHSPRKRERKNILNRFMDIWTNGIHSLDRRTARPKWATSHCYRDYYLCRLSWFRSSGGMELLPTDQGQIRVKLPSGAWIERGQLPCRLTGRV